jgi:hypothetical protein
MCSALPRFLIVAALILPNPCFGQSTAPASGSDSLTLTGAEAGRRAGSSASVGLATWGTAAANVFLGPIGGLGALGLLHPRSDLQSIPDTGPTSQQPAYQAGYQEAYRIAHRERFRRAAVRSVLIVSAIQIAGFFLISGTGG